MSAFEKFAIQRLVDQAQALGVPVPGEIHAALIHASGTGNTGARLWVAAHPDDDGPVCCYGAANGGPEACYCWQPVYEVEQAEPHPPTGPDDLRVQDGLCGDCAFRKGSPERSVEFEEQALFELARGSIPFFCHSGMRKPLRWEHPDGRVIEGDPADYTPPMAAGIPYQADGSPGLLCAGWAARAARATQGVTR